MTKTLTEQWKDGELETGHYYIQWSYDCDPRPSYMIDFFDKEYNDGEFMLQRHKYIDEVLAPVPSYDEYCNLVFQANKPKNPLSDVMMCYDTEREKKVVERLQEQLKEANEAIKEIYGRTLNSDWSKESNKLFELSEKYLEKWGVK